MDGQWQLFQSAQHDRQADPAAGLLSARDGASLCELSHDGLISVDGSDAQSFLHGQFSSDVQRLDTDHCQLSTYNSPKGRVLATALVWRTTGGFLVQVPRGIVEPLRRRLAMFVLRSKVRIEDASERLIRFGLCGPNADAVLVAAGIESKRQTDWASLPLPLATGGDAGDLDRLLHLPGNRHMLIVSTAENALWLWNALVANGATVATDAAWRWSTVQSGIAEIQIDTQDQFVPQMLNYELVGGISFTKGCYPGQEIVARAQYRSQVKRRTFLAHADVALEPIPAQAIFHSETSDQAAGAVVNAAPAPSGGCDLLACLHTDFVKQGSLHLGTPSGPRIELRPLPYALPEGV